MFTAARVVGADSSACSFVVAWGSTEPKRGVTVERLQTELITKGQPLTVLNESGRDLTTSAPVEAMLIRIAGRIIGTAASDNWTYRTTLGGAVVPDQGAVVTPLHGTFYGTPPSGGEIYCPYHTVEYSPVFTTEAPFTSSYSLVLENPYGYWRTVSGDTIVKA